MLAHERVDARERDVEDEILCRCGVYVGDITRDLASGELLHEQGCTLEGVDLYVGVDAALETERGVGIQAVALGRLADRDGVEVCALEEYVRRGVADARIEAAEDASDTHRTHGRTYHQILRRELALHAVERDKGRALGAVAHDDLVSLDLVGIEGVQGLSQLEEDVIGYVDQIVLGVDARGAQFVLHPLGRGGYLAPRDREARISGRCGTVLDDDLDRHVVVVDGEGVHRGKLEAHLLAAAAEVGRQIARHAYVRGGVDTVGREAYAYQIVILDMEKLACRHSHRGICGQLHDAGMVGADAELVLGAEHTHRLDAADLAALDLEGLVTAVGVEHRADGGAENLESLAAVGGAADDAQRSLGADVYRRDVQVVGVGMVFALDNLTHDNTGQAAAYGLHLAEILHLEAYVGEYFRRLFGRDVEVDILFQPVERYLHDICVFSFVCAKYGQIYEDFT